MPERATRANLPPHAYVILGMLRLGARTGYEIKQAVELSARFFWTISRAQIYPGLSELEEAGLVRGREEPQGRRRRRVYELTDEGERVLAEWLRRDDPMPLEVRDLGMLKLFFGDLLEGEQEALDLIRAIRRRSEERLRILRREAWPAATEAHDAGHRFPLLSLRLGIAYHEAMAETCAEFERELGDVAVGTP